MMSSRWPHISERRVRARVPLADLKTRVQAVMKKAKFLQEVKLDPARFYRNPTDIMRDRRLTDEDRMQILAAWERNTLVRQEDGFTAAAPEHLERLRQVRAQLERGGQLPQVTPVTETLTTAQS